MYTPLAVKNEKQSDRNIENISITTIATKVMVTLIIRSCLNETCCLGFRISRVRIPTGNFLIIIVLHFFFLKQQFVTKIIFNVFLDSLIPLPKIDRMIVCEGM